MSDSTLIRWFEEGRTVLGDGAMGTVLQAAGLPPGSAPELWNLEEPHKVEAIYGSYIEAGSDVIATNSFGGNLARLKLHQLDGQIYEVNRAAAKMARGVADRGGRLVAGSMGPTGDLLEPMGLLSVEEAASMFVEQARGLIDGGVDFVLIETMSQLSEVEAAVMAVRRIRPDVCIAVTMSFDRNGHTMMGVSPVQALTAISAWGVRVIGANCGNGPDEIEAVMTQMGEQRPEGVYLVAQSNAGVAKYVDGETHFDGTPEVMAAYTVKMHRLGINYIGACCGSTPAHIKAMHTALEGIKTRAALS